MPTHILAFHKLRLFLRIGCDPRERAFPQPIDIDMEFHLSNLPKGCHTDDLNDVICYRDIVYAIHSECENQEFKLIEKLAYFIAQRSMKLAKCRTTDPFTLIVKVTKVHPPIEHIHEGVSFTCQLNAP
ncbi:MAG: dihydroneopterin aldolase [Chlamydiia bacterium]|nr:dihydroneopterin aldolase [Chlamydiia bacterium]MCP5509475.1 dihydroneopterin aldolase [Chlamydiales bacterium]